MALKKNRKIQNHFIKECFPDLEKRKLLLISCKRSQVLGFGATGGLSFQPTASFFLQTEAAFIFFGTIS